MGIQNQGPIGKPLDTRTPCGDGVKAVTIFRDGCQQARTRVAFGTLWDMATYPTQRVQVPNIEGLWSSIPCREWLLEPES